MQSDPSHTQTADCFDLQSQGSAMGGKFEFNDYKQGLGFSEVQLVLKMIDG